MVQKSNVGDIPGCTNGGRIQRARAERNAINSYEYEVPLMYMFVRLDEHALHESNIGSEFERG
jgi:hypothetical protein